MKEHPTGKRKKTKRDDNEAEEQYFQVYTLIKTDTR